MVFSDCFVLSSSPVNLFRYYSTVVLLRLEFCCCSECGLKLSTEGFLLWLSDCCLSCVLSDCISCCICFFSCSCLWSMLEISLSTCFIKMPTFCLHCR